MLNDKPVFTLLLSCSSKKFDILSGNRDQME